MITSTNPRIDAGNRDPDYTSQSWEMCNRVSGAEVSGADGAAVVFDHIHHVWSGAKCGAFLFERIHHVLSGPWCKRRRSRVGTNPQCMVEPLVQQAAQPCRNASPVYGRTPGAKGAAFVFERIPRCMVGPLLQKAPHSYDAKVIPPTDNFLHYAYSRCTAEGPLA